MIKCEIINDILPLFVDDVCGKESRELIEEHVKECASCRTKLENMRGEVNLSVQCEDNPQDGDILKSIKKRFLKKNVIVASVSILLSIAILISAVYFVFFYERIIPYEEGLAHAEIHNVMSSIASDETIIIFPNIQELEICIDLKEGETIDISSAKNVFRTYSMSRDIEENGHKVTLTYINFSDTVSTKWNKGNSFDTFVRIIEPQNDSNSSVLHEIYYLNSPIDELSRITDLDEYAKLREQAFLVFSGNLDSNIG